MKTYEEVLEKVRGLDGLASGSLQLRCCLDLKNPLR